MYLGRSTHDSACRFHFLSRKTVGSIETHLRPCHPKIGSMVPGRATAVGRAGRRLPTVARAVRRVRTPGRRGVSVWGSVASAGGPIPRAALPHEGESRQGPSVGMDRSDPTDPRRRASSIADRPGSAGGATGLARPPRPRWRSPAALDREVRLRSDPPTHAPPGVLLPSNHSVLLEFAEAPVDRPAVSPRRLREFARGVRLALPHLVQDLLCQRHTPASILLAIILSNSNCKLILQTHLYPCPT